MRIKMNNDSTRGHHRYTVKDVIKREDHAELIDNTFVVTEKTSTTHNNAVLEIAAVIRRHVEVNGIRDRVFIGNVALYCDELCDEEGNLFLPDVMVVHEGDGICEDGIHTSPSFIAEVATESTLRNDYGRKMMIYRDIGVMEYWVVDLKRKAIVRYLEEKDFVPEVIKYEDIKIMPVNIYPGLAVDLSNIFLMS